MMVSAPTMETLHLIDGRYIKADDAIEHRNPKPAKLKICIVEKLDRDGDIGVAYDNERIVFIDSSASVIIYPHEVGHLLDLSTKHVGPQLAHDAGPWPQAWKSDEKVGLMYEREVDGMTRWIRRKDWFHAYQTAKNLMSIQ
jgi:hypothetical protein